MGGIYRHGDGETLCDSGPRDGDSGHMIGTYRMGTDPKNSVVDKNQRSHDHGNLFLIGSGVFPTTGTSNPTLTITALTLWAAQTVNQDLVA